ncbi:MAG: hypothetical protein SGJ27_04365 [Candidatus Melainabacteria bacterium]|nr:hypothetical protein [Candidatus Melainabacteria bacterium]
MQTIQRETSTSEQDDRLVEMLHKPIEEIDLAYFNSAVQYLRNTVNKDIAEIVRPLGTTAVDVAGTGGSGIVKFNTSTAASFILAAHGVDVIKFGNRSITGPSGSLDFLGAIGCLKEVHAADIERVFKSTNLLFLSAPNCYPNLASIRDARKTIGRPTIFNFIGPLLNPARPAYRLMGISNSYMHLLINQFIKTDASTKRAITAHSTIRTGAVPTEVDEILPYVSNTATLIEQSLSGNYTPRVSVIDIGCQSATGAIDDSQTFAGIYGDSRTSDAFGANELGSTPAVNSADVNAKIFLTIIDGNDTSSIHYKGLLLNAAAAFLATGAVSAFDEGVALTKTLLANKSVKAKLDQVRRVLS